MAEEKAKLGRPSIYTEEIATEICERIANGESLRIICKEENMPSRKTVHLWLLDKDKETFLHQYEIACNIRAENMFDELEEIADNGINDWSEREYDNGNTSIILNGEAVARSRLRVDTRKWYLSKVLPKKFGDKLDVTSDNQPINKISIEIVNGTQTQIDETDSGQLSV